MQETLIGPHILINKEYVKLNYKDRDYNQKRLFLQGKTEKLSNVVICYNNIQYYCMYSPL